MELKDSDDGFLLTTGYLPWRFGGSPEELEGVES